MKHAFDEAQVERAFAVVRECVLLVGEHLRGCIGFLGRTQTSPPKPLHVTREALLEAVERLRRLRAAAVEAGRLLDPMSRDLPLLGKEPVRSGNMEASSWARAAVANAEAYAVDLEEWEKVAPDDDAELRRLIDRVSRNLPDVGGLMVRLEIEEAHLRERARAMSPEVRYAYAFQNLKPQSRKLFRFFVGNSGRHVGYEEIAEVLYGDRSASNGRIQSAVYRLRTELQGFGSNEEADAIGSEDGAYWFQ